MFWRRKKQREVLPWYRDPGYRGPLTEAQKRELDAFRMQPTHPAARYEDLPDEVQAHIARLEVENYDQKQYQVVTRLIVSNLVGAALVYFYFFGTPNLSNGWLLAWGLGLLIVPWFTYPRQWRKNADEFITDYLSEGRDSPANESLKKEWEISHVSRRAISDRNADIQ
jgi:hypothetical protein